MARIWSIRCKENRSSDDYETDLLVVI